MQDEPLLCQGFVEFHIIRCKEAAEPVEKICEFPGVIGPFKDVFQDLQISYFFIRQPRRRQDFIRPLGIIAVIAGIVAADAGALEELQEADLQLVRTEGVDVVEGLAQMVIVFIRQADDEVQMEVHRPQSDEAFHDVRNARPVIMAVDGLKRRLICRLDAHFQLDPSFRRPGQEIDIVIGEDAGLDFQVEIDGLIDADHVFDEGPMMSGTAVKGAVDELDLMDAGIDEGLQFLQDQRD